MNHQEYQRKLMMTENKNNQEFKIRKIKRDYKYSCRVSDRYFDLFLVFFVAGIILWTVMHVIFDACIDSWIADPKLQNFQYMWNVLMKVIPFTLWALAGGFIVTCVLCPLYELIFGNIMILLLKCRMRRENKLREGRNDATH
ncbi:F-type conjugal transfer protein TrbF [Escherichia coli]|nr:F-type conjugal transfer protein TrbF [Escherichia coli]EMD6444154.1 F-type conjugal transfer protein TrbF [Salmonella enterica]EES9724497.1 F-type conjugal transfer protein TrbF [Escherichia coli]EGC5069134.1 F-type conjugal transfer protein TrbF [Escherichia coli]EGJ2283441.1 F-type conjugal transfer protein TrbF [Escherichia coli]